MTKDEALLHEIDRLTEETNNLKQNLEDEKNDPTFGTLFAIVYIVFHLVSWFLNR